jgi:hypothetical protein
MILFNILPILLIVGLLVFIFLIGREVFKNITHDGFLEASKNHDINTWLSAGVQDFNPRINEDEIRANAVRITPAFKKLNISLCSEKNNKQI